MFSIMLQIVGVIGDVLSTTAEVFEISFLKGRAKRHIAIDRAIRIYIVTLVDKGISCEVVVVAVTVTYING